MCWSSSGINAGSREGGAGWDIEVRNIPALSEGRKGSSPHCVDNMIDGLWSMLETISAKHKINVLQVQCFPSVFHDMTTGKSVCHFAFPLDPQHNTLLLAIEWEVIALELPVEGL